MAILSYRRNMHKERSGIVATCHSSKVWHMYETRLVASNEWQAHKNHAVWVRDSGSRIDEDFGRGLRRNVWHAHKSLAIFVG